MRNINDALQWAGTVCLLTMYTLMCFYPHLLPWNIVAGVCGVVFTLPYYEEYGAYESEDVMSHQLENTDNEFVSFSWRDKSVFCNLQNTLESMESDARGWHSSTC